MLTKRNPWLFVPALIAVWLAATWTARAADSVVKTRLFEITIPAYWVSAEPDLNKTAVLLLLNGTVWYNADAMIKVDVGKPSLPTAREIAQKLAGDDGKVYDQTVNVDGSEGVRVETTSTDMSRPKYGVVVFHEQRAYLIMGAEVRGKNVAAALDQIIKSWKWSMAN